MAVAADDQSRVSVTAPQDIVPARNGIGAVPMLDREDSTLQWDTQGLRRVSQQIMLGRRPLRLDVTVAKHAVDGACRLPQRCDYYCVSHIASVHDGMHVHCQR
jgi:hypothetical protein